MKRKVSSCVEREQGQLDSGPEISSRPIVRDDHTKRPDDYENNFSRPVDDQVFLDNLRQALLHTRYYA